MLQPFLCLACEEVGDVFACVNMYRKGSLCNSVCSALLCVFLSGGYLYINENFAIVRKRNVKVKIHDFIWGGRAEFAGRYGELCMISCVEDLHSFLKEELKRVVSVKNVDLLIDGLGKMVPQIIPDFVRGTRGKKKCNFHGILELLLPVLDYDKAVCRLPVSYNDPASKCSKNDFSELVIELSSDMDDIIAVLDHALGIDGTRL